MKKKVLVVVDMQNDFITGTLGSEQAKASVAKVAARIKEYQADPSAVIIYTLDTHHQNYLKTREGRNLPVEHCIRGTWGWELCDEIKELVRDNDVIIEKDVLGSTDLGEDIKSLASYETDLEVEVELLGLYTDMCILYCAIAVRNSNPEIEVYVNAACCVGITDERHKTAIEAMRVTHINIIE